MSLTTIPIEKSTRNKLREFAKKSESWNDLLNRLYETAVAAQHAEVFFATKAYTTKEMLDRIDKW